MSKIPPIRRISIEDFKDQADWIGKLLVPINLFFDLTSSNLNRSLTIADNFAGDLRVVELDGTYPLALSWTLLAKPVAVMVGQAVRSDGSASTLTTAVQVQWSFNQSRQLSIDGVVGIVPSTTAKYQLSLVCLTG